MAYAMTSLSGQRLTVRSAKTSPIGARYATRTVASRHSTEDVRTASRRNAMLALGTGLLFSSVCEIAFFYKVILSCEFFALCTLFFCNGNQPG